MTDFTIIEAPSNLGLKPDSVEHLADALLDAGLARRLDARRHARLAVPPYDPRRVGSFRRLVERLVRVTAS